MESKMKGGKNGRISRGKEKRERESDRQKVGEEV